MTRVFRASLLAAAGAALAAGAPLAARDVGGWDVARSKQGACMMTATFDDDSETGVALSLVWDRSRQQLGFLAASKHWDGLRRAAGDPTELHMTFDGEVRYTQWVHEGARFDDLGGGIEAVMGVWGEEHRAQLAEAVTGSGRVALRIGETEVGTYDLAGAGAAYRELLRCGERG